MALTHPFSQAEIQQGLPAGRAQTLLFLIEARTAHRAARTQQVADLFPSAAEAQALDQAFLQAIRTSGDLPRWPTIQEIEQYTAQWATLVPVNPQVRATVAHLLGAKYQFTAQATPTLQAALGLQSAAVQAAYQQRYHQPLATIYTPQTTLGDRLRWATSAVGGWVDQLPPFWQSCVLMLAMSFPQAALALSIAVVGVGPLVGIGLIVLFGLINMVTVAALAEAVVRNGAIRYGNAFLGRVAADYLGPGGSLVMTLAAGAFCFLGVIAAFVGLAKTLASFTPVPAIVWATALFAINLYRLARQSLKLSLVMSLLLAATVIGLLLLLAGLAFTHFQVTNLTMSLATDTAATKGWWQPALLQALLGVLLTAFYGHIFVSQVARVVLPREPSGRALIGGSVTAFAILTVIFVLWVLAVSGAVAPQGLASASGTVLIPLATALGPGAKLLGALIVVLLPGLASIRASDVLFNLVRERLPGLRQAQPSAQGWIDAAQVRVCLCVSPLVVAFLLAAGMLLNGGGSFARIISLSGVMTVALFAGVLPVLLLVASRRKGDFAPSGALPWLSHPLVLGAVFVFFVGIILLHGLVIWQTAWERGMALALVVGIGLLTAQVGRRGAFTRRLVVELRQDQRAGNPSLFTLTAAGQPLVGSADFTYPQYTQHCAATTGVIADFAQLQSVNFWLPATTARELKVWVHRVTPEGNSESLPVQIQVIEEQARRMACQAQSGAVLLPLHAQECQVQIRLGHAGSQPRQNVVPSLPLPVAQPKPIAQLPFPQRQTLQPQ